MKTKALIIIPFLILLAFISSAQLKYEGLVDSKYKTMQLDNGEFKYLKYNKDSQELFIYNVDNTLWKTITLPLPENHLLDEVKNISHKTFVKDDLLEVAYSCVEYTQNSEYENPNKPFIDIEFTFNIVNELGEQILKVKNSNEMKIIDSDDKKKLLIFKHIGSGAESVDQTVIYSLP